MGRHCKCKKRCVDKCNKKLVGLYNLKSSLGEIILNLEPSGVVHLDLALAGGSRVATGEDQVCISGLSPLGHVTGLWTCCDDKVTVKAIFFSHPATQTVVCTPKAENQHINRLTLDLTVDCDGKVTGSGNVLVFDVSVEDPCTATDNIGSPVLVENVTGCQCKFE